MTREEYELECKRITREMEQAVDRWELAKKEVEMSITKQQHAYHWMLTLENELDELIHNERDKISG